MITADHIVKPSNAEEEKIWAMLEEVTDPEIPVLSIVDMGIVHQVKATDKQVEVIITPTYSGCPAMDMISMNIRIHLVQHGYPNVQVTSVLSPAWTTDWMTESGKKKLQEFGIAPPQELSSRTNKLLFSDEIAVECPRCHSTDTRLLSQFGSTACKALYQCNSCKEPFDYFKCH